MKTTAARSARAVVFAFSAAACAGSGRPRAAKRPPVAARAAADAGPEADAAAPEPVPSLDVLAARGPTDMRELVRVEDATKAPALSAGTGDTCFRGVVAASAPVRVWFEDERHEVRGGELAGISGLVPPSGPVCARRGETLRLVVEPRTAITARAVIWRAP